MPAVMSTAAAHGLGAALLPGALRRSSFTICGSMSQVKPERNRLDDVQPGAEALGGCQALLRTSEACVF
jgi:hypothetical protein